YLTSVPKALALLLADHLGSQVGALARTELAAERPPEVTPEVVLWEEHLRQQIEDDSSLEATEKQALVLARRGQGLFRMRVQAVEVRCRITGVERPEHLRASHIKPWRDCNNQERLAAENGL